MRIIIRKISKTLLIIATVVLCINLSNDKNAVFAIETKTNLDEIEYEIINDEVVIIGYSGENTSLIIPSSINGLDVTSIGEGAFINCIGLISIGIPSSVTNICNNAFDCCRGLIIYVDSLEKINEIKLATGIDDVIANPCLFGIHTGGNATCTKNAVCSCCGEPYGELASHEYEEYWTSDEINHWIKCKNCDGICDKSVHTYNSELSKATPSSNGYINKTCSICGNTSTTTIYKPTTILFSETTSEINKPAVIVKDSMGKTISNSVYTLSYSYNTISGTGKVSVIFNGSKYNGVLSKNFTIEGTKISAAQNVTDGITLTWNKVSGATKYQVFRRTVGNGWVTGWIWIKDTTGTTITDKTAEAGKTYDYVVKPFYGTTKGVNSANYTAKRVAAPKLNTPSLVTNGIKVSWAKVTGASKYQVFRRTVGNGWTTGWTWLKDTTSTSFIDTTAKKGTTYEYAVKAFVGTTQSACGFTSKIKR